VRGLTPAKEEPIAITMARWKFVALAAGAVAFRDLTQSTFVQVAEQTYRLGVVLAGALCVSLPSTLLLTNKRLTRPPEHITSRQERTASANFHQLRDVIE
jgi:hypothetical protein